MDHRKLLGTVRTTALRSARTAGRMSVRIVDEVQTRVTARRATRASTRPPGSMPGGAAEVAPGTPTGAPSPLGVARVVARNRSGLTRTTTQPTRPASARRDAPGAKLPARAGRGILGV